MAFEVILLLLVTGVVVGWVNGVVGGGGLIQLPVLLLVFPDQAIASVLGTGKLAGLFGNGSAAIGYARRVKIEPAVVWPTVGLAVLGSGTGALFASSMSSDVLRPVIMLVLLTVALLVTLRPQAGTEPNLALRTRRRVVATVLLAGLVIGGFDGLVGPGTGVFLVIAFSTVMGLDFVTASAHAKIVNAATNAGALTVFALNGHVMWLVGLGLAASGAIGAQLGAGIAIRRGSKFVRIALLVVVLVLLARMSYDVVR